MDEKIGGTILAVLLSVWLITSTYFLSATGITLAQFMTIDIMPLINEMTSLNFIVFLIALSISIGIILVIGKKYLFKYALIFIYPACVVAIAISYFLFQKTITELSMPILGLLIGIPLGIKFLCEKELEIHYLVKVRSGASAAGRILLVGCVAFFIMLLLNGYSQQLTLEKDFVPQFLGMTVGEKITLGEKFQDQFASALATQQQTTIETILDLEELKNLENKNDPDALNLTAKLQSMKTLSASNDFKKNITDQLNNQNIDFGAELTKQLPMIKTGAKYAWILYAISGLFIVLFTANLIVKTLSAILYSLILLVYPKAPTLMKENPTVKTV